MTKQSRHEAILELIGKRDVSTQEELLDALQKMGFSVTQATVSRDIRQLRLVKTLRGDGKYAYALSHNKEGNDELARRLDLLLAESVVQIDHVLNQVVIKCYTGHANALCATLDSNHFPAIVGTLAGDDTILVILRSEKDAENFTLELEKKFE